MRIVPTVSTATVVKAGVAAIVLLVGAGLAWFLRVDTAHRQATEVQHTAHEIREAQEYNVPRNARYRAAMEEFQRRLAEGRSRKEAMRAAFGAACDAPAEETDLLDGLRVNDP